MARHFGIGFESTWNTPVAPVVFFEVLKEDVKTEKNWFRVKTIRSRSTRAVVEGFGVVRGTVEIVCNFQDLPILFYLLHGNVTTTGTNPYTHTIPQAGGPTARPALTLEIQRDSTTLTWRYAGCVLTSLAIAAPNESAECRVTIGFIGASENTGTAASPTFPTLDVMLPKHLSVSFDGTVLPSDDFNLNVNFPTDEPGVHGSVVLGRQPTDNDVCEVLFDVTVIFENLTQYNKFKTPTDVDVAIVWTGTAPLVITLNMNKTRLLQATPPLDGRTRLKAVYEGESFFDATATENLQMVAINNDAVLIT